MRPRDPCRRRRYSQCVRRPRPAENRRRHHRPRLLLSTPSARPTRWWFRVERAVPTAFPEPGAGSPVGPAARTRERKRWACSGSTKSASGPSATRPRKTTTAPAPTARLHLGESTSAAADMDPDDPCRQYDRLDPRRRAAGPHDHVCGSESRRHPRSARPRTNPSSRNTVFVTAAPPGEGVQAATGRACPASIPVPRRLAP
jgi:hypothetical protein